MISAKNLFYINKNLLNQYKFDIIKIMLLQNILNSTKNNLVKRYLCLFMLISGNKTFCGSGNSQRSHAPLKKPTSSYASLSNLSSYVVGVGTLFSNTTKKSDLKTGDKVNIEKKTIYSEIKQEERSIVDKVSDNKTMKQQKQSQVIKSGVGQQQEAKGDQLKIGKEEEKTELKNVRKEKNFIEEELEKKIIVHQMVLEKKVQSMAFEEIPRLDLDVNLELVGQTKELDSAQKNSVVNELNSGVCILEFECKISNLELKHETINDKEEFLNKIMLINRDIVFCKKEDLYYVRRHLQYVERDMNRFDLFVEQRGNYYSKEVRFQLALVQQSFNKKTMRSAMVICGKFYSDSEKTQNRTYITRMLDVYKLFQDMDYAMNRFDSFVEKQGNFYPQVIRSQLALAQESFNKETINNAMSICDKFDSDRKKIQNSTPIKGTSNVKNMLEDMENAIDELVVLMSEDKSNPFPKFIQFKSTFIEQVLDKTVIQNIIYIDSSKTIFQLITNIQNKIYELQSIIKQRLGKSDTGLNKVFYQLTLCKIKRILYITTNKPHYEEIASYFGVKERDVCAALQDISLLVENFVILLNQENDFDANIVQELLCLINNIFSKKTVNKLAFIYSLFSCDPNKNLDPFLKKLSDELSKAIKSLEEILISKFGKSELLLGRLYDEIHTKEEKFKKSRKL